MNVAVFFIFQKELEGKNSSEESDESDDNDESSDDEHTWTQEVKKQHRIIQREHRQKELQERLMAEGNEELNNKQPKLYELREGAEFRGINSLRKKMNR